ncbi:uncharacterized mitochondrial protein AtMg00860-like [Belonocnema kinseyi]|uniref:uncharacterized mitochondrial protein AtMg00860-like n=1 Tax=Belonocnema kinseyi TaxID=2817044 RepID=UPI00143D5632|nr:uncharacterized mitochondrial protein AtMg00860-like [Belonocnema kinseyi]
MRYLGFLVNQKGFQVDPDKIEPLFSYPASRTIKQLRRFLGMASWYRRFIPDFASDAKPLIKLLRTNVPWEWVTEQENAFAKLKEQIATAPILTYPDFDVLSRHSTGRLARWALDLLEYDFEVVHRKGALHHVPDALSRMDEEEVAIPIAAMEPVEDEWYRK